MVIGARLPQPLHLGDVGIVEVRQVGNRRDASHHVGGDRPPHPRHLFAMDRPPIIAVGGWHCIRTSLPLDAPQTDGGHDVLTQNPPSRPAPLDATEINAELTGEPSHRRTGGIDRSRSRRRHRSFRFHGGLHRNRRRGNRHGIGRRDLGHGGGDRDWRRLGGGHRSGLRGRRRGAGRLEGDERLPHLDSVPLLDQDARDAAPGGAWHLDDGLVGFDFQERLARLDHVPGGDKHGDDIAGGDVFAQIGQLEIGGHGGVAGGNGRGWEGGESRRGRRAPRRTGSIRRWRRRFSPHRRPAR